MRARLRGLANTMTSSVNIISMQQCYITMQRKNVPIQKYLYSNLVNKHWQHLLKINLLLLNPFSYAIPKIK